MWSSIFILIFGVSLFLEGWWLGGKSKIFKDFIIRLTSILAMITITLINFIHYALWGFVWVIIIEFAYLTAIIIIYIQDRQINKKIEEMVKDKEK